MEGKSRVFFGIERGELSGEFFGVGRSAGLCNWGG